MTAPAIDLTEVAARWQRMADAAPILARAECGSDPFEIQLREARGEVRGQAARLLRDTPDRREAARLMHTNALAYRVWSPPIFGYDAAAIRYTKARTWQACAWELDPSLPEAQSYWD